MVDAAVAVKISPLTKVVFNDTVANGLEGPNALPVSLIVIVLSTTMADAFSVYEVLPDDESVMDGGSELLKFDTEKSLDVLQVPATT